MKAEYTALLENGAFEAFIGEDPLVDNLLLLESQYSKHLINMPHNSNPTRCR